MPTWLKVYSDYLTLFFKQFSDEAQFVNKETKA